MSRPSDLPPSAPVSRFRGTLLVLAALSTVVVLAIALGVFSSAPAKSPSRVIATSAPPASTLASPSVLPPSAASQPAAPGASAVSQDANPDSRFLASLESLSDNPHFMAWAREPDLLHRLTAAINLVADGESPRPVLAFLAPKREFKVIEREGALIQSSESTERYDLITRTLTSLRPAAVARFYAAVRPLAQVSLAAISKPGRSIDAVTHEALSRLIDAPIPVTEPALVPKGAGYAFADPSLESLPAAEKNLVRTGVSNARAIHAWMVAVEKALPLNPS